MCDLQCLTNTIWSTIKCLQYTIIRRVSYYNFALQLSKEGLDFYCTINHVTECLSHWVNEPDVYTDVRGNVTIDLT